MFAPPPRAGTICGWEPSNDSHDYAYTTTNPYLSQPPYAHPSLPLASTPRAARNPIPRSLSLDSAIRPRSDSDATDNSSLYTLCDTSSSYTLCDTSSLNTLSDTPSPNTLCDPSSSYTEYDNPTSLRRYKEKRSQDPTWAPRPPNAFILFRRDYVSKHKGEKIVAETKQQQKTLSKRASDAWKSIEDNERDLWYTKAKIEELKHAAAHPDYVFRPKKRRSEPRRHPAMLSRREQVEEFVRKSSRRRALAVRTRTSARFASKTPGSARSSASPEPTGTPSSVDSNPLSNEVPAGLQPRSDSLPARLDSPGFFPPMPNRGYMSQAAMLSMPSLVSERPFAPKRSFSHSDMQPYSPWDYVNLGDDYSESDDQSIFSFDSVVNEPSPAGYLGEQSEQPSPVNFGHSLHTPDGHYTPDGRFVPEPLASSPLDVPEPLVMPAVDPTTTMLPSSSNAYPPPSPLFERRRRAATISTLPSPLTVITSSLSGWARDDLVTARMVPRADPSPPAAPPQFPVSQPMLDSDTWERNYVSPVLLAPPGIFETDMDNTPRVPDFPQNILSVGPSIHDCTAEYPTLDPQPQRAMFMPITDPYDVSADLDLEAYNVGLNQFGISVGAGAGVMDTANYCMPLPSFDVDYSELFPGEAAQE